MSFLLENCTLFELTQKVIEQGETFDCGHVDLNEFFSKDCLDYRHQLLGKSYCFRLDSDLNKIVAAFTVSNDSIKTQLLPRSRKQKLSKPIPQEKRFLSYPAILIGRLGVSLEFKRNGVGCDLLDFIKGWFVEENNKSGCRFVVVDAYNEAIPLQFYEKNGFQFLFTKEEEEKKYLGSKREGNLKTRLMYFDLLSLLLV